MSDWRYPMPGSWPLPQLESAGTTDLLDQLEIDEYRENSASRDEINELKSQIEHLKAENEQLKGQACNEPLTTASSPLRPAHHQTNVRIPRASGMCSMGEVFDSRRKEIEARMAIPRISQTCTTANASSSAADQSSSIAAKRAVADPGGSRLNNDGNDGASPRPTPVVPPVVAGEMVRAQPSRISPSVEQTGDGAGAPVEDGGDLDVSLTVHAQRAQPPFSFPFRVLEKADDDKTNAVFTPNSQLADEIINVLAIELPKEFTGIAKKKLTTSDWLSRALTAPQQCARARISNTGTTYWTLERIGQFACRTCTSQKRLCLKHNNGTELWLLPLHPDVRGTARPGEVECYKMPGDVSREELQRLWSKKQRG